MTELAVVLFGLTAVLGILSWILYVDTKHHAKTGSSPLRKLFCRHRKQELLEPEGTVSGTILYCQDCMTVLDMRLEFKARPEMFPRKKGAW